MPASFPRYALSSLDLNATSSASPFLPRRNPGRPGFPLTAVPKCPRCGAPVTGSADELGFLSCGGCGARLRKAPTVKLTIQSPTQSSSTPVVAAAAPPPSVTGNRGTDTDTLLARIERVDASATLPPGAASNLALKAAGFSKPTSTVPPSSEGIDGLKSILQAIQKDMATLKQGHQDLAAVVSKLDTARSAPAPAGLQGAKPKTPASAMRPLLILDDDAATAEQTRAACVKLGFAPVVASGARAALDAMARERPALLVLEPLTPGEGGELSGRDFVNYVKSTMEWIEIPILAHTRATIANHEQARCPPP